MLALLAMVSAALIASPVRAQDPLIGDDNIRAELHADGTPEPGETWTLAFHFIPKSQEWHGYWSNPGDAGLGMQLEWELPEGWVAGEPLYPVPERLLISELMNHIYEGNYAVLVPISVPEDAAVANVAPISVTADYLACTDRICVPQQARLTLDPNSGERDPRFDRWRAAIAPMLDSTATFEIRGDTLRLAIPLPSAMDVGEPHVFIENISLVNYTAVQTFSRGDDLLVAEIPLGEGVVPDELGGIISFGEGQGVRFEAAPGEVPALGKPLVSSMRELPSIWLALLGAFAGGLLLNILPCVFPILSLKALALAKAGGSESAARRDALAYTAGVVIACLALGGVLLLLRSAGENVGWAFQLQEPIVVVGLLVLAVAITANLAGVFALPGFVVRGGSGGRSSFATGFLAAFVATPCTGPFMAAALGAALLLPPVVALALFGVLGLGLAFPFLALGFVPALRNRLPKPGQWMETFRKWMALPMGLTALALVWLVWRMGGLSFAALSLACAAWVVVALRGVTHQPRSNGSLAMGFAGALLAAVFAWQAAENFAPEDRVAAESLHEPIEFSEAALTEARATGQPVFIWFTADWCVTCKVNERIAIEREEVVAAFEVAGVITMRGDWTRRDEEITAFLTEQGAAGVPLYLWYPAGGGEARQLPQLLTAELLAGLPRSAPLPDRQEAIAAGSE